VRWLPPTAEVGGPAATAFGFQQAAQNVHTCTRTYCTTYPAWFGVIHDSDEYQTCLQGVQHTSPKQGICELFSSCAILCFSRRQNVPIFSGAVAHTKRVAWGMSDRCCDMPSSRLRSAACPGVWLAVAGSWLNLSAAPCLKPKSGLPE
jgi:hypothetical protein